MDLLTPTQSQKPLSAEDRAREHCDAALPRVSIVMPIYNEAAWIDRSLTAVLRQDYPGELVEVLIADSRSDDGTIECIRGMIARHPDRRIRLLENPLRTPGAGLNLMIRHSEGDIILRVDGHAEVAPDYVRRCVATLQSSDASNVGGCISASGRGVVGRGIAMAIGSFWGNGGARYRSRPLSRPTYVDTVQFGAWRRETLARLGPFVASWSVNEDCEFNARILDAGGKILLHPAIRAMYFPRSSLRALAKQYFRYGRTKCKVIARHPRRLRARQVAPPLLVLGFVAPPLFALLGALRPSLLLAVPLAYTSAIGIASVQTAFRNGHLLYAGILPAVFATLHFSYGVGLLAGLFQMAGSLLLSRFSRGTGLLEVPAFAEKARRGSPVLARDPGLWRLDGLDLPTSGSCETNPPAPGENEGAGDRASETLLQEPRNPK